jgi:hypothetical protein
MECGDRTRLDEVLKVASHELTWLLTEEVRLTAEEPHRLMEFRRIVEEAEEHRKAALNAYIIHLAEHGCRTIGQQLQSPVQRP